MTVFARENIGGRVQLWHRHTGPHGEPQVTVETVQDVEPVIRHAKAQREITRNSDFRFRGAIPATVIEDVSKINARLWGCKIGEAFTEIMQAKTDRAKRVWKTLLGDSDYSKLQGK